MDPLPRSRVAGEERQEVRDPPRAPAAVQLVYLGFACSPSIRSVLMLGVAYGLGNGELLLNAPLPEAKPHPHRPMWRVDDGLSP